VGALVPLGCPGDEKTDSGTNTCARASGTLYGHLGARAGVWGSASRVV